LKKLWVKSGKVGGFLLILLLLIILVVFKPVDWTPYQETAYYDQTMKRLHALQANGLSTRGDTLQVGWARVNITPSRSLPLAGYGKRKGKHFEEIFDSVFVRAFVFDNGVEKAALVTIDLLIMPPEVTKLLAETLPESFPLKAVFLTATHSHSSFGSWAPGLVGKLFAGSYDHIWVEFLAEAIVNAIMQADSDKIRSKVGFAALETQGLLYNRLEKEKGSVDPWLRIIKIEQDSGETAFFATFAAHPTILRSSFMKLSAEYPGVLIRELELSPEIDFAAFGAGAMASQGPVLEPGDFLPQMDILA